LREAYGDVKGVQGVVLHSNGGFPIC
jgi:hypothetical protein